MKESSQDTKRCPRYDPPNSRRAPLSFDSRDQAHDYAKAHEIKVWAKIWSWAGVFEIYPGGREIWHKND